MKKVISLQSQCSYAHTSLAVAIPILSVLKNQVISMPTKFLAMHTGYPIKPWLIDLPQLPLAVNSNLQQLNVQIDAIYTGYLGSTVQIENAIKLLDCYPNCLKFIDPVMGDNGKLYAFYTTAEIELMKKLVSKADIITPNLTEACALANIPYQTHFTNEQYQTIMERLTQLGAKKIIITSAILDGIHYNLFFEFHQLHYLKCNWQEKSYPGTGDIFASCTLGYLLNDYPLVEAIQKATSFIEEVIASNIDGDQLAGLPIEDHLAKLLDRGV